MNTSHFVVTNNGAATAGYLIRNVAASSVLFPVGTTTYIPVTIDNSAGTADAFWIRVFNGDLSAGTSGAAYINSSYAVNKTWLVEEVVAGGSNASLTVQWSAADENASFDRTNSFISHYIPSAWDVTTGATATTVSAGIYTQTRMGLTSFSPYSVQERLTILPVRWLQFTAAKKENTVVLKWTVAEEPGNVQFDIERSTNGIDFKKIGFVKAKPNGTGITEYSFTDQTPFLTGTSYYRLKQLDKDGQFAFSKILSIKSDVRDASIPLFPVPLKEQLTVVVNATAEKQALLYVRDATGKLVKKQTFVLTEGSNTIQVPVAQLSHGIYTIQLIAGEKIYSDKIIK